MNFWVLPGSGGVTGGLGSRIQDAVMATMVASANRMLLLFHMGAIPFRGNRPLETSKDDTIISPSRSSHVTG
jgi:hypothetical protein